MNKLEQVRAHVLSALGKPRSGWILNLKTEADAIRLVDDVCEGDYDPKAQWPEAFEHFKFYFKNYAAYCEEMREDYDRMFG